MAISQEVQLVMSLLSSIGVEYDSLQGAIGRSMMNDVTFLVVSDNI